MNFFKALGFMGILCLGVYVWWHYFGPLAKMKQISKESCLSVSYEYGYNDVAEKICQCVNDVIFANVNILKIMELYEMKMISPLVNKNIIKVEACRQKYITKKDMK